MVPELGFRNVGGRRLTGEVEAGASSAGAQAAHLCLAVLPALWVPTWHTQAHSTEQGRCGVAGSTGSYLFARLVMSCVKQGR